MTRGQFRITWLVPVAVAGAVLLGGVMVYRTLDAALLEAEVAGTAASYVRSGVAVTLIILGLLGVAAAALATRLLAGSLSQMRGSVLARARGDTDAGYAGWVEEVAAIDQAVERLAARLAGREADMEREGVEVSAFLDAISEGILQVDSAGRIVRANPRARALLRLDANALGQPASTQVRHVDLRLILDRAAAGAPVEAAEIAVDDRRLLVSARPLPVSRDGQARGAVIAFVDLTEVRRLEGVRRDFVANVSHELKTPLTSIRGYTETMLHDDLPPELQRQFLEVVHKNADRLHRIVDDLLDLSRLESGGWRPEPRDMDVREVVDDVWSACTDRARDRRITFVPPADSVRLFADPAGVRQVLSNLLENSLRYTPEGGRVEVRVCPAPDDVATAGHPGNGARPGLATIEVRDNGPGIPTDALPRIFERFYRVDPARSREAGGTGLGLSIVKHLVDAMGGEVSAESELGKGTTVRVRLPGAG